MQDAERDSLLDQIVDGVMEQLTGFKWDRPAHEAAFMIQGSTTSRVSVHGIARDKLAEVLEKDTKHDRLTNLQFVEVLRMPQPEPDVLPVIIAVQSSQGLITGHRWVKSLRPIGRA